MAIDEQIASPEEGEAQTAKTSPFGVILSIGWTLALIITLAVGLRVASARYQVILSPICPGIGID